MSVSKSLVGKWKLTGGGLRRGRLWCRRGAAVCVQKTEDQDVAGHGEDSVEVVIGHCWMFWCCDVG